MNLYPPIKAVRRSCHLRLVTTFVGVAIGLLAGSAMAKPRNQADATADIFRNGARGVVFDKRPLPFQIDQVESADGVTFTATIVWTSLGATHRIEGRVERNEVRFKETDYIQRGAAAIGCEYQLQVASSSAASGTRSNCPGIAEAQKVALGFSASKEALAAQPQPDPGKVTLPRSAPNEPSPEATADATHNAHMALAATDFAQQNCPSVAVNFDQLDALLGKAGLLAFDARREKAHAAFRDKLRALVAQHGLQTICYELQTMFLMPQKEPLLTRLMYRR